MSNIEINNEPVLSLGVAITIEDYSLTKTGVEAKAGTETNNATLLTSIGTKIEALTVTGTNTVPTVVTSIINHVPTVLTSIDNYVLNSSATQIGNIGASDIDKDILIYTISTSPTNGTITIDTNGNWKYTAKSNYSGNDKVIVSVSDGKGGSVVKTLNFTIQNVIYGTNGVDYLAGTTGADKLVGGLGNDIYVVDNGGDVIIENANEGTDTINSSISYTLAANLENLTLTGLNAINGIGNSLNNNIVGNSFSNTLDGGAGNDNLYGGIGNDTYLFGKGDGQDYIYDNDSTVVNVDTVMFKSGVNSSDIVATRDAYNIYLSINGTTDKLILGNYFNDIYKIEKVKFADGTVWDSATIIAKTNVETTGNDYLGGTIGTGADKLIGGLGNDTYIVDNVGDVIVENANEGTDSVNSSISYTLAANLENLTLLGSNAINGTGNQLANYIYGNGASNILDGGAGNDYLYGGAGNDTIVQTDYQGFDTIDGGTGNDTIDYSSLGKIIFKEDFTSGMTQSSTDYSFQGVTTGVSGIQTSGQAQVATETKWDVGSKYGINGSTDKFLFVDGATDSSKYVYKRDVNLVAGQTYIFSFDATQNNGGMFDLVVGNEKVSNTVILNQKEWNKYTVSFVAKNSGLQTIGLKDINTNPSGNDFGLDNIALEAGGLHVNLSSNIIYKRNGVSDSVFNIENIIGTQNYDLIAGNSASNTLDGGAGDDFLAGYAGNDTYIFGRGYGQDDIYDYDNTAGNVDTVMFKSGVSSSDIVVTRESDHLIFNIAGAPDRLQLAYYFYNDANKIEKVQLSDGNYLTSTDIDKLIQSMSAYASSKGISLSSVNDVSKDANLMNMIASTWSKNQELPIVY